MGFDFNWTCPQIDKKIDECKDGMENMITDILEQSSPLLPYTEVSKHAATFVKRYYESIFGDIIEEIRSMNIDMRKEAEKQIESLEKSVETLEEEIGDLQNKILDLEKEIENLHES
jgi:chromosome segregation ATPase